MSARGARLFVRAPAALAAALCALGSALFAASAVGQEPPPLVEEPIVAAAQKEVAITATFAGGELFVYGAVARNRRLLASDTPLDVVIVLEGPSEPVIVRKKQWIAGLWINAAAIRIAAAPSFYGVASTRPVPDILRPEDDATYGIGLDKAVLIAGVPYSAPDPEAFRQAAIRLRRREGLYVEAPGAVTIQRGTLFQGRFQLPANIVEGDYIATVYLVRDKRVIARDSFEIPVARRGLERFLYVSAQEHPTLYALGTLLTALIAGYLASEIFRRLRRGA